MVSEVIELDKYREKELPLPDGYHLLPSQIIFLAQRIKHLSDSKESKEGVEKVLNILNIDLKGTKSDELLVLLETAEKIYTEEEKAINKETLENLRVILETYIDNPDEVRKANVGDSLAETTLKILGDIKRSHSCDKVSLLLGIFPSKEKPEARKHIPIRLSSYRTPK